jgi:hypothetical protein
MKLIKKIAAIMFAFMMVFSLSTNVKAEEGTGKIILDDIVEGQVYKVYQLFTLESYKSDCIFPFNYFRLDVRKPHVFVYFSPLFTSLSEIHYGNESFCIREPLIPIFHNLF